MAYTISILEEDNLFLEGCRLALEAMQEYKPISIMDEYLTEAFGKKKADSQQQQGDQNQQQAQQQEQNDSQAQANAAAVQKGESGLKKMFTAIRTMITKMKTVITDFLARRKMDKAEHDAIEAFEAAAREDPNLKNARITVMDFKKTQQDYAQMMEEYDKQIRAAMENEQTPIQKLLDKGKEFVAGNAKGFFHTVNAVGIINMAGTDKNVARFIKTIIESDENRLKEMEAAMGEKQFKKFNKKLNKLTKPAILLRAKLRISHRMYNDVISAYAGAYQSLYDVARGKINVKDGNQMAILGGLKDNKYTGQTMGAVMQGAGAVAGAAAKGVMDKGKYEVKKFFSRDPESVSLNGNSKKKKPSLPFTLRPSFEPAGGDKYKKEKKAEKEAKRARYAARMQRKADKKRPQRMAQAGTVKQ